MNAITLSLPFILSVLISNTNGFINHNKSVQIHGKFMCGQQPVHRAAIELWNDNQSLFQSIMHLLKQKRGPDDEYVARTNTNETGEFTINATFESVSMVRSYIYVYHRCDADELPISKSRPKFQLWRTFVVKVPEKYINTGDEALKKFDLGVYNLQFQFALTVIPQIPQIFQKTT